MLSQLFYLNGTAVLTYAVAASQMTVFYLNGTACILQEWVVAPGVEGNLFFVVF
jgi:hypothetical protein